MHDYTGCLVRAKAGRDKEGIFCVIGVDGERLLLADGKRRKISTPKAKSPGHVELLPDQFDHEVIRTLKAGNPVSDRALRKALAAFKEGITLG